ncbi:MAG: 16S rRNA (guanine(966)-N(2))-methyltransferase RsmD [Cryobacterium sp.]|nr:16S rRNA (guanine(966)-N(2))-methyltransferase RsmD [Cryobacterium sp.]
MTRIIAGFAGSLALAVPGAGTRPTSDRVREAIFSALESREAIRDARVIDLFAGSGALGLEAASRGAASVTLVERDAGAVKACRDNTARILRNAPKGSEPRIAVAALAVQTFLDTSTATWDLALLDPPYGVGEDELARALSSLRPRLASEAIILVERASKAPEPAWPAGITLDRRKDYGDTTLWWASAD